MEHGLTVFDLVAAILSFALLPLFIVSMHNRCCPCQSLVSYRSHRHTNTPPKCTCRVKPVTMPFKRTYLATIPEEVPSIASWDDIYNIGKSSLSVAERGLPM
ncbi:hypothetical protein SAICODRAFT_36846 [Saitoella complicata NRRL Y-17804]|nr:uncharacterized protein SAICODRAFT_36846 [Saitoella complicata NRRL Y-17804]ODQ50888.1 hypothetical protein SAICODRAFT_36846 [Saitoella complicata NRRL Y-17804]